MVIYVDDPIFEWQNGISGHWCHMIADGGDKELHAMARKIRLKSEWFQDNTKYPHYDLTSGKRTLAIKHGAIPVDSKELLDILRLLNERRG